MSENEKEVQTKTEEITAPVEEEKDTKNTNEPVELTKLTAEEKPYSEVVEEFRQSLYKDSKKQSTLSFVSMGVVFLLLAAGFICFSYNQVIAFILIGVAAVFLISFSLIVKRICAPDVKGYIKTASTAVNRYIFNDGSFTECTYDNTEKIVFGEIAEDGAYDKIKECVSRDVVNGKYLGRTFKAAELGIYKEMVKRTKPTAFVGKYLTYPNDLHFVGRIVIVSRGNEDIDIPGGIDDLTRVMEDDKFAVYVESTETFKDLSLRKFLDAIKAIEIKDHLLTLCVVLWAGRSIVYASYDDASVTLPFDKPIDVTCYEQYRKDLMAELEALHMLIGE